jgi:hypothetical protein
MEQAVDPVTAEASHSSAGEVSAYLERALSREDRNRVEAHLADCTECRREVVELSRLLRARRTRRVVLPWAAAAGIAATLAILVGRLPHSPAAAPVQDPGMAERGTASEEGAKLRAWGPTGGASIGRDSLVLAWSPRRGGDLQYHITVADSAGGILWTASTTDTMLRPPPSLTLPGARTYYWYTDALLPDGRSLSTGVQEFRLAP